jgi:hypothetical protein
LKDEGVTIIFALIMLSSGLQSLLAPSDVRKNSGPKPLSEMALQMLGAAAIGYAMFLLARIF